MEILDEEKKSDDNSDDTISDEDFEGKMSPRY